MKKWNIIYPESTTSIEEIITILLTNRKLTETKEIDAFLHPDLSSITPETVGIDKKHLAKTLKRLRKAIDEKEQVIVYGDYDVDGITGTAILWETLHDLKGNVMPYIPHRIDEGYGLSVKGIENVLEKYPDTKIIVTVDNGIVASDAVNFANEKGLEVIITDHHVPESGLENLPKAFAIVHTTKLCGAGVGYVLSKELRKHLGKSRHSRESENQILDRVEDDTREDTHLELVALATVADLVPLTGANRTLITFGLKKLCNTKREGLLALFQEAACDNKNLGVYEIGHIIAPRLNASGRLTSAMDSLRLLCTRDAKRAYELASKLGMTNKERQTVMFEAAEHAKVSVKARKELKKLLVVAHESYPQGVIGLVAGRLVEEYYRPSIVIARGEKYSKGSVRSVNGFNIIEFLRSLSDYFVNVGGHPMAAGFTIETDKIELLQEKIEELTESLIDDATLTRTLRVDMQIPLQMVTESFYNAIQKLSPFGMGNPEPLFVSNNVTVQDKRIMGKMGNHVKFVFSDDGVVHDGIAFGMAEQTTTLEIGSKVNIAYSVDENNWNGRKKLQLKIKDIKDVI